MIFNPRRSIPGLRPPGDLARRRKRVEAGYEVRVVTGSDPTGEARSGIIRAQLASDECLAAEGCSPLNRQLWKLKGGEAGVIKRIHHVGIVVSSVEEALPFYNGVLGMDVTLDTVVEEQGVRAALLQLGDSELELLEPVREGTGVARFLEKQGGLHHVCFETDDIEADLSHLKQDGVEMIDQVTRDGVAGRICFMHPRANNGVLIEYCQPGSAGA